ncbi:Striatin-interacting protein 2 [Fasciola hepatica]|uniref:Striatin-interacting protein 2 n=1 Tax=Fasciola hepatica TaxID=6192 RepID=A0A4E0RH01_FASHE|nr:Striatin-interacting protein 2 [Fasciola hepatica]
MKKTASSLTDSADLRVILSILYVMVETVRDGMVNESPQSVGPNNRSPSGVGRAVDTAADSLTKLREQFCEELVSPIANDDDTTLTVVLFGMVHRFCSGLAPHLPVKKVLLLLWKVLLVTLGPITTLFVRKNAVRARYNLPPLFEDSNQVIRRVRANSPPGNSTDQILSRIPRNNSRYTIFGQGNQAPRQGSLASGRLGLQQSLQQQTPNTPGATPGSYPVPPNQSRGRPVAAPPDVCAYETSGFATPRPGSPVNSKSVGDSVAVPSRDADTPMPGTGALPGADADLPKQPMLQGLNNFFSHSKTLPWKPKVRKKDLETFLTNARLKFVGFHVPNDITSLAGLPEPIHEAVKVMREHLYVSLGEVQIERENNIARNPMSMGREEIPDTPVERLYRAMYPLLPQYMIALLKVLLAAAPTSRAKTEPTNILAEVMPAVVPNDVVQKAISNFDVNRHRELIVKAISAILLLLLKHMKLNHVYQFEYVSQYLVIANCIPLILKFFNQNTCHYVQAKNTHAPIFLRELRLTVNLLHLFNRLPVLDFPSRLIGKAPELALESLLSDWSNYCWRNLFACINLLRVLNMLTKWKHSRTMLLVVFKSAPILKRTLRVRHAMMQLYVLKLLKLQSRYFGRQWRKNNMSIMSAIYQKVRHRLTDDWAYGNDVDALPWQFQVEEYTLRTSVDQFNQRRYSDSWLDPLFQPVDNSLMSVLSQPVPLSDEFKRNYEKWLEEEVFSVPINWSQVLAR